jgi:Eukaryotic aspartyl protease
MPRIARIPITNVNMGGDYTGKILVGPHQQPMNVILDSGSSALALDGRKYHPAIGGGDQSTKLAQSDSYGDGSSWTGAVIKTSVSVGEGATQVTVSGVNAAVAYDQSANMFQSADGILGLAYAPLDDAFQMPNDTSATHYTGLQVTQGTKTSIPPYLTQLADQNVVSDKVSFLTRRSFIHQGGGGATDPLNQGWMIVGGGEENTDLYTGSFQTAKILTDEWYNTNLKAVLVGTSRIPVRARGLKGMPSNSIVDSGTNSLNLGPHLLKAILSKFDAAQQAQLTGSIVGRRPVAVADLNLATWPDLTFVLQGDGADVSLRVSPNDYWQVNAPQAGAAMAAITQGDDGMAILGLPLMNGYFTIFDGEADGGRGVIKFATSKR